MHHVLLWDRGGNEQIVNVREYMIEVLHHLLKSLRWPAQAKGHTHEHVCPQRGADRGLLNVLLVDGYRVKN